jgi:uncharacterized protein (DUF2141 family)
MKHLTALAPLLLVTPLVLAAGPELAPQGQTTPPVAVQPPRDTQSAEVPVGTGAITGTVVTADSGQPARRVRVNLSGTELRGGRSATTDDSGTFAFAALPAGRYNLSASKSGYVSVSYGQRRPGAGRPGTPIQLGDGQKLQVQLQIPRGGVITGTVLDEHGEAIPGTPVRVMRYVIQSGVRTLQSAGNGTTDDRGVYRVYGLQPGEYVVAATPRNASSPPEAAARAELMTALARTEALAQTNAAAAQEIQARVVELQGRAVNSEEPMSGYAAVYYPGTTAPASAATVIVGVSEEKMGVDFGLQIVPLARVEGVVVTTTGQAAQNIQVSLVNLGHEVPGIGNPSARPDRDGRFRLTNVPPGQYMLVARGTLGGQRGAMPVPAAPATPAARAQAVERAVADRTEAARLWAMADVSVDGRNQSNLVLTLQPGMSVSGRLVFEGALTQPDLTRARVTASPINMPGPDREIGTSVAGRVDSMGRFTLTGVVPGRYRITGSAGGEGWSLASSVVSGQDTLDFPVDVKPNQNVSNVVLTFSDKQAEITGAIVDAKGQPAPDYTIIVYPADREFWTSSSRRIRTQRPGTDGQFTFGNLPPGDYRIAPVLDPEPGVWYDPSFLQQLDAGALRVPLGVGEKKVQNLRISAQ